MIYFIITLIMTKRLKSNYYKFDNSIEQIDKVYYDSYNIFLKIKKGIENFTNGEDASQTINIPKESEIEKPKFGNILMNIINNNRYTNSTLQRFSTLYNSNSCSILSPNDTLECAACKRIFSSILTKGIEQSIVQMGIIITSCLDELSWVNNINSLLTVFKQSTSYQDYETFMGKFLMKSFWETQKIFEVFRDDEKQYIFRINNILLVAFMCLYIILLIVFIYFIYDYVKVFNSFLNFISILPSKFICDDDALYQNILKLQEFY